VRRVGEQGAALGKEVGRVAAGCCGFGQPLPEVDHRAAPSVTGDDAGVVAGVGCARYVGDECVEVAGAADPAERTGFGEPRGDGHRVGGYAGRVQLGQGPPQRGVRRPVEVVGGELVGQVAEDDGRGEQRSAEDGTLGGQVVRWRTVHDEALPSKDQAAVRA
jgi:hypothetical protein